MPRRSMPSLLQIGSALALAAVLAGCTKGGQFDPTEILNSDAFDSKKKLKGDREAVFPNGVPGTTFGVPPDLVKGYQPPPDQSADTGLPPAPATKATAAEKSKATAKPKPKLAAAPKQHQDSVWNQKPAGPTRISVGPAGTPAAPNAQAPAASSAQTPWPAPPPTAPGQQAGQSSQSVWPNPPAPAKATQ
jgi:hypothetical protein